VSKIKIGVFLPVLLATLNLSRAQTNNTLQPYIAAMFANNADTIQKWYTANFDFTIKDQKNIQKQQIKFCLLEKDGFLLEIIQRPDALNTQQIKDTMKTYKYLSGLFKTGFYVKDVRAWYNRLKLAGVKIESENVSNGQTGHYILCVDPEGNLVQLFQKEKLKK
jgi:predicted enzyme related to lactoylglutathione lyase